MNHSVETETDHKNHVYSGWANKSET